MATHDADLRAREFYRMFVTHGSRCFDVGANVGDRTEVFLDLGARVVAVEPQKACADVLRHRFGRRVEVVEEAVGDHVGHASLRVASYHTLSSLSTEWVDEVRSSGRFAEFDWEEQIRVPVTTLDTLVERFGRPDFCKIDVEGYELEVVRGLSTPIPALSYEFTVERLESRLEAARLLDGIGMHWFNFSFCESLRLVFADWLLLPEFERFLRGRVHTHRSFGDVYARS